MRGVQVFTMGWMSWAANDWLLGCCWLGMISIFASLLVSPGKKKIRLALAFYSLITLAIMAFVPSLPLNDSGDVLYITPGLGYVIWFLGCIGIFLYHFERLKQHKR